MHASGFSFSRRDGATGKSSTQPLLALGLALGGLSMPLAGNAGLIQGYDATGYRTGEFRLDMGAGELVFFGKSTVNSPAYDYQTTLTTGTGTQLIYGAPLATDTLIDAHLGYMAGSETLYDRWQSGYMAYQPGGGGCDRWSCWSYPGYYYSVITGSGVGGAWAGNTTGLLGFRFEDNGWHYGWVELTVSDNQFDIGRWAYEDAADVGIVAGSTRSLAPAPVITTAAIPEPSTMALLALGAAGVAAFRRRSA